MLPDVKLCYLDELVDCYKPHIDTALSNKPFSAKKLIDHTIPTRLRSNIPNIDSVSNVFKNQILVPNSKQKNVFTKLLICEKNDKWLVFIVLAAFIYLYY